MGAWLTIPSTVSAEAVARVGFDYVCIDLQHGGIDAQMSIAMTQAVAYGGGHAIARVPWNEPGVIGKLLDAGADGLIVPMVNSADEARAVVRAMRYPPHGMRSYGPYMPAMRFDDYHAIANDRVAVIPMIETAEAISQIDEILSVPGIDAIYVGPSDLSISLGLKPINNDGEAAFDDALAVIVAACQRHGIVPGIHSTPALVQRRLEQGFRMITVNSDALAIRNGLKADLATARGASAAVGTSAAVY